MRQTFVIVGAGLTGGSAVICLREVDLARLRDEAIQVRDLASG
jgi:hypothetical protein